MASVCRGQRPITGIVSGSPAFYDTATPMCKPMLAHPSRKEQSMREQAFVFDLDGTLVDSVYQHVLAWQEALDHAGIAVSVWRIHRRIGMSGGLIAHALLRETGRPVSPADASRLRQLHTCPLKRRSPVIALLQGLTLQLPHALLALPGSMGITGRAEIGRRAKP
jgi:hypothetical protein